MIKIDITRYVQDRIWFGYGWIGSVSGWRRLYLKTSMYWRIVDGRMYDVVGDTRQPKIKMWKAE